MGLVAEPPHWKMENDAESAASNLCDFSLATSCGNCSLVAAAAFLRTAEHQMASILRQLIMICPLHGSNPDGDENNISHS